MLFLRPLRPLRDSSPGSAATAVHLELPLRRVCPESQQNPRTVARGPPPSTTLTSRRGDGADHTVPGAAGRAKLSPRPPPPQSGPPAPTSSPRHTASLCPSSPRRTQTETVTRWVPAFPSRGLSPSSHYPAGKAASGRGHTVDAGEGVDQPANRSISHSINALFSLRGVQFGRTLVEAVREPEKGGFLSVTLSPVSGQGHAGPLTTPVGLGPAATDCRHKAPRQRVTGPPQRQHPRPGRTPLPGQPRGCGAGWPAGTCARGPTGNCLGPLRPGRCPCSRRLRVLLARSCVVAPGGLGVSDL